LRSQKEGKTVQKKKTLGVKGVGRELGDEKMRQMVGGQKKQKNKKTGWFKDPSWQERGEKFRRRVGCGPRVRGGVRGAGKLQT